MSPGETIALLTEMDCKMKLVEDVTGEEVSEMHARSALVGIVDLVNNSTTSQEAMQIGRVEAGATAPTTAWPPLVAETSEDSWEDYDVINAMGSQECWTCKGYGRVSRDCSNGKGQGKDNFGKGTGAYEWGKSDYKGNKGSNHGTYKEAGKDNLPSSYGPVQGYQKGDGKSGGKGPRCGKCYTSGGDPVARDCPKVEENGGFRALDAWETWEEPPLVEHARVLSLLPGAPPKHAGPQRVPPELRKKSTT